MRTCRRKRRSGFALVATLWLLIALGAVGLDAALRSRTRRQAAANVLDGARARAAALAGSEYARSMLTAPAGPGRGATLGGNGKCPLEPEPSDR